MNMIDVQTTGRINVIKKVFASFYHENKNKHVRNIQLRRKMGCVNINMCRLCADYDGPSKNFIPIFENSGPTNFAEKIKSYLHIDIENSSNAQYEPRMCHSCCEKIVNWDLYVEQVQKVQGMFITFITTGDYSSLTGNLLKEEKEKENTIKYSVIKNCEPNQKNKVTPENVIEGRKAKKKEKQKEFKKKKKKKVLASEKSKNEYSKIDNNDSNDNASLSQNLKTKTETSTIRLNNINQVENAQTKIRLKIKPIKEENNFNEKIQESLEKENKKVNNGDEDNDYNCDVNNDGTNTVASENLQPLFTWECLKCHAPVKNWNALVKHCREKHDMNASVQCVCGKFLQSRASIMKHRMTHTIGHGYRCEFENCNKTFHRQQLLNVHSVSHMPKELQPWMCCKCSRRFHTESLLKQHEKIHLPKEEKLIHPCQVCQKKFCSKSAVSAHMRAVHFGERPFVCDQCGHSFTSKGILHEHLTIHSDVCNFHCKDCNKSFKTKYRLKIHMDTHVSTRYQCPTCNLTLNTRRTLRMHLLVHKDDRAFKCSTCGKAFKRSKDLKNHCNLHTGRRPYTCPFCQRTFANGSNCRSHKRRMHPEELKMYEAAMAAGEKIDLADFSSNSERRQYSITLKRKDPTSLDETKRPDPWSPYQTEKENWENEFEEGKVADRSEEMASCEGTKIERENEAFEEAKVGKESERDDDEQENYESKMSGSDNVAANVAQIVFADQSQSVQYPIENFYAFEPSSFASNPLYRQ